MMKRFAIAAVVLGLSALGHSMDLATIETQIRRAVHDNNTTASLQAYPDATLLTWINDAQREIVNLTWCVETSTSYVLTAQTTFYSLPTNFIALRSGAAVTFTDNANQTYQLQELSQQKIYETEPDFEHTSIGPPSHYFTRFPGTSADAMQIAYLPVPTTTSTGTVKVWYYYMPADLASASDLPFDGFNHLVAYHWAIVDHVTAKIKALESKPDEAALYMNEFTRIVTTMTDRLGRAPNASPHAQGAVR